MSITTNCEWKSKFLNSLARGVTRGVERISIALLGQNFVSKEFKSYPHTPQKLIIARFQFFSSLFQFVTINSYSNNKNRTPEFIAVNLSSKDHSWPIWQKTIIHIWLDREHRGTAWFSKSRCPLLRESEGQSQIYSISKTQHSQYTLDLKEQI